MRNVKQRILIELEAGPMPMHELHDRLPFHHYRVDEEVENLINDGQVKIHTHFRKQETATVVGLDA